MALLGFLPPSTRSLVLYSSSSMVPISDHRAPSLLLCSSPCLAVVGGVGLASQSQVQQFKEAIGSTKHCALTGRRDWLRRRKQLKLRFGSVVPISGSDFVREVSQAPSDVWVVVILYKDGALKNLSQDIL
ncbi:Phosducin-like protein [Arachis hypogaea]|nr:Phosducin-like protein [Arachis hypogaea]